MLPTRRSSLTFKNKCCAPAQPGALVFSFRDPHEQGPRHSATLAAQVSHSPESPSEYAGVSGDEISDFGSDNEER